MKHFFLLATILQSSFGLSLEALAHTPSDRDIRLAKRYKVEADQAALQNQGQLAPVRDLIPMILGHLESWSDIGAAAKVSRLFRDSTTTAAAYRRQRGRRMVKSIVPGSNYTCLVTETGEVYCFGKNNMGQLGNGTVEDSSIPVKVDVPPMRSISTGSLHTCGITWDGRVFCWGSNVEGQFGNGTRVGSLIPVEIPGIQMKSLAVSIVSTCGLNFQGRGFCWGSNATGHLGVHVGPSSELPIQMRAQLGSSDLPKGSKAEMKRQREWEEEELEESHLPVFKSIFASLYSTCALSENGETYCWAYHRGQKLRRPVPIDAPRMRKISVENDRICGVIEGGKFDKYGYCLGDSDSEGHERALGESLEELGPLADISTHSNHTCALTVQGQIHCWGENYWGQLGDGSRIDSSRPIAVQDLPERMVSVATGNSISCGTSVSGDAYCWGFGRNGQLGNGTWESRTTPILIQL